MNSLIGLRAYGQSFWYDHIRRQFLRDGTIEKLITRDGLSGMTANPSIFARAIESGEEYDRQIMKLAGQGAGPEQIYEALLLADIQAACDLFSDLYQKTDGADGYVSLEVSPHLSDRTEETIAEARRWFATVERPNLMIKVPATRAGIPAIRQLISQGININITLMFSISHYEAVAQAYIDGLTHFLEKGGEPGRVASVASFFVSRVDTAVDRKLSALDDPAAEALLGKSAIANSKLVYQRFKELFLGDGFAELRSAGARPQRLLWASTSTKNPDYPDTMYIDELIGAQTINTMPPATIDAFRDHGRLGNTLEEEVEEAQLVLVKLGELGIDLHSVTEQLQRDGIKAFARSFDGLLTTLASEIARSRQSTVWLSEEGPGAP